MSIGLELIWKKIRSIPVTVWVVALMFATAMLTHCSLSLASGISGSGSSITGVPTILNNKTLAGTTVNTGTINNNAGTFVGGSVGNTSMTGNDLGGNTVTGALTFTTGTIVNAVSISSTGTISSTKACAAGFTRVGSNFCMRTDSIAVAASPVACTAVTLPAGDAKALLLAVELTLTTQNAVGNSSAYYSLYDDAACTWPDNARLLRVSREYVATVAGTLVDKLFAYMVAPVTSPIYEKATVAGGAGTGAATQIRGYWDM